MKITEVTAADYLDHLRSEIDGYLDLSFPTIAGYKENAAMMHYEATPDNCKELEAEGMLLVDSGGQYLGGTTDVTRTICAWPRLRRDQGAFYGCGCGDAAADQRKVPVWLYGKKPGYSGQTAHVGQKYRL